jgi:2-iminobutanoate/2-iminopropanoate deaminase
VKEWLMDKEPVTAEGGAPPAGPYSPSIRVGDLLFVSGQGPFDAAGNLVGTDFAGQARAVFENIARIVRAAGGDLDGIVRVGAYLKTLNDFAEFNDIMREVLPAPYPARTTVPADLPGFLIEVDAVAVLPPR